MKNNIIIYSITLLTFLIVAFFWNKLELPFRNANQIVSYLTIKEYNPNNDTLRYIVIIFFPLIIFTLLNIFSKDNYKINIINLISEKNVYQSDLKIFDIKLFIFLFIIIIFFDYVLSFQFEYLKLDLMHDGDFLGPAKNFLLNGQILSSNLSVHGSSNTIYPVLAWKLFGVETIGAYRIFLTFLIFLLKIFSVFLAFQFTKLSKLKFEFKIILFIFMSMIMIDLSSYNLPLNYSALSLRDLYVIIFLIFLIQAVFQNNKDIKIFFILSFIPFLTIVLHVDTGIYIYCIFILFLFYLLTQKEFFKLNFCLILNLALFILFFFIVGKDEFYDLFSNIYIIAKNIDLIHGIEFPQPFFEIKENIHGSRASKTLMMQLIAGLIIINQVFFNKDNYKNRQKIIFIFIFILSFIMFKNALGRSDSYHIRMSSEWPTLIICFFILEYLLFFVQSKIDIKKINLNFISILLIALFFFMNIEFGKFKNLLSFKSDLTNYINHEDEKFLNNKSKNIKTFLDKTLEKESCIANISLDLTLVYLLKKPSCTKFTAPYLASGNILQKEMISELQIKKPNFIIYSSSMPLQFDAIPMFKRLPLVNDYLDKNYKNFYDENGYVILKIKDY